MMWTDNSNRVKLLLSIGPEICKAGGKAHRYHTRQDIKPCTMSGLQSASGDIG